MGPATRQRRGVWQGVQVGKLHPLSKAKACLAASARARSSCSTQAMPALKPVPMPALCLHLDMPCSRCQPAVHKHFHKSTRAHSPASPPPIRLGHRTRAPAAAAQPQQMSPHPLSGQTTL